MAVRKLRRNVGYGVGNPLQDLAPLPIISDRNPTTSDAAELGTTWINKSTGSVYVLARAVAGSYTWSTSPASGVGTFTSLTVTTGDLTFDGGATGNITMPTGNLTLTAGNAVIGGDLTVTGTVSYTGDIDITTADVYDVTATGNQDPAIRFQTNGGTTETISILNSQGTADDSIDINSTAGGVILEATNSTSAASVALSSVSGGIAVSAALKFDLIAAGNSADAVTIEASNGGIDILASGAAAGEDIDIIATGSSVNISSTEDVNDSISIGSATGGINLFSTASGAGKDITITGGGCSVVVTATENVSDAIVIEASGAGAGVQVKAGSAGILIGNEADTAVLDLGNIAPTASRAVTIGGGTVATASVTDTINIGTGGASANGDSIKIVNIGTGALAVGVNTVNIATGAVTSGTHAVNVSTGTGNSIVTVGNADGLTTTNIIGAANVNSSHNFNTAINDGTSTGTVTIGNAAAGAITVDTAAGISLDAATASNFTVSGAANLTLSSTGGRAIVSGGSGAANDVTLNAVAAGGGIDLNAGSGGVAITADGADIQIETTTSGTIELNSVDSNVLVALTEQSAASPTASVTINAHVGHAIFSGFTTAAAGSQVFTITNSVIAVDSPLMVTVSNQGANDAQMTMTRVEKLAGSFEVTCTNNGAAALNGNVNIAFWCLQP